MKREGEYQYCVFDLPKILFFQMFSVPTEFYMGPFSMFKGSLLSKGEYQYSTWFCPV